MKALGFYRRVDEMVGVYKAPADVVDYSLDWVDHLGESVALASATWTIPSPLVNGGTSIDSQVATARISGGVANAEYSITCTITKSNSEVVARTFVLTIAAALS
jgi:hypothetical protein